MTITLSPMKWTQPLNPEDEVDYTFDLQGTLLEVGEGVTSWDLVLSAASIAAGLTLGSAAYVKTLTGTVIKVWFSIDVAHLNDAAFNGTGAWLDMEVSVVTNNAPPRIRSRTLLLRVSRQ